MLNTNIEYTSAVNVGSTFWFTVDIRDLYVPVEKKIKEDVPLLIENIDTNKSARMNGMKRQITSVDPMYVTHHNVESNLKFLKHILFLRLIDVKKTCKVFFNKLLN